MNLAVSLDAAQPAPPTLEARAVSKSYGTQRLPLPWGGKTGGPVMVVERVSLQLEKGRISALIGESGSGKSTMARLLAQLEPPTAGEIALEGVPVRATHGVAFRSYCARVQLMLQDPFGSLNPRHTVGYHLRRPLLIHQGRFAASSLSMDERVSGLLEQVSLAPGRSYIDRYPHELSGGQRQRVAIARALACQPDILLADEPVSMLDVSIRAGVLMLLDGLRHRVGLGVLYITHDLASAGVFADDAMVMYAGEIIERGPARRIVREPAHPYTQLLIAAAPDPARVREVPISASGAPANPARRPSGCRFHPRCPHVMAICREQAPSDSVIGPGHTVRCWLFGQAQASPQAA